MDWASEICHMHHAYESHKKNQKYVFFVFLAFVISFSSNAYQQQIVRFSIYLYISIGNKNNFIQNSIPFLSLPVLSSEKAKGQQRLPDVQL